MAHASPLGQFLRARRAQVDPADSGLLTGADRRVPGLRREEVAVLAGVSADYYARLEQGRERNPSAQILDAIARAFTFDADTRGHLYRLAGLNPGLTPTAADAVVHALRLNAGLFPADPDILAVLEDVADQPEFAQRWGRQRVGALPRMDKTFHHPEAGRIDLTYQSFDVRDAPGQQLQVGTAPPGSRSEQALTCLGSVHASV